MPKASLDLTGQWEFKEYPLSARRMRDLDVGDWLRTPVPCSIFTSLIAADKIKQSDIDANPENFSWVSEKPWIYRKTFDAPAELLECGRIDLVFDGLDTIASIWLNDKLVSRTNNMFIPFRFDVTEILKPKDNSLLVKFEPPVQYAKKLMERYTSFSESDFINPYRVYVRKAQYQFGWDWCPSLPGCGVWRPVRLEGVKKARLADLHIRTVDCNQHYADVKIETKLDVVSKETFLCKLTLSGPGQTIKHELTFKSGEDFQSTVIRIDKPVLWWPSGYGEQNLYAIDVQLLSGDEIIDRTKKFFGIRTVKLNRSPDGCGQKFQFEINGQPVFAKGANWIPASIFAGSVNTDDYEQLLNAAVRSNINMLRVWGGGYYEASEFYELCDRLGIMVWQDFMFACAYYPDRQWFIDEVKTEAVKIVKRLRNHPCVVLWCGNNEIDWMHSVSSFGKRKKFYGKAIYHKLLPRLLSELDPDRDYIPTTPLSADRANPNEPNSGTIHQWNVWSGYQPVRNYLRPPSDVPRFVTEFGFQSLPDMQTIKNFCSPEQLRIGSFPIEKHNYQLDGNSRLHRYLCDLFGTAKNLEQFVYLSQVTQARAVKVYVEHLRSHNFRNSGVLFWQFNDCCPAISWSAIDHTKKPKALYYYAKRFFSKRLITVVSELGNVKANALPQLRALSVVAINDSKSAAGGLTATLNCRLLDLAGNMLDNVTFPIALGQFKTSAALKLPKAMVFPAAPDRTLLHLVIDKDGEKMAENFFFYLPDKYIDWPNAEITKQLSRITDSRWELKLKTDMVVKDVQINSDVPAQFSDNFIDMLPGCDYEIIIDSDSQLTALEDAIHIRSVRDVF